MKKHIFKMSFLCKRGGRALWLTVLCLLAAAAGAVQSGDYTYTINANGTIRIDEYTGSGGALIIPSTLDGKTVVGIGRYAFSDTTNLTSVAIPDSIIYLEEYAFTDCVNLTEVAIGKGVDSIGFMVFNFCGKLTSITVDAANAHYSGINGVLFSKSQNTLIQYPAGKAGNYTIPAGVTNIGEGAFDSCAKLTGIVFPDSVISIDDAAFWGCTNLPGIALPDSLTSIGMDAFWNCAGLTSLAIPRSVTNIGPNAFYECVGLSVVTLPASVADIGGWAFGRCNSLTSITVDADNAHYSSSSGVLFNKNLTMLIQCPGGKTGSYLIPSSVTNIAGVDDGWPSEGLGGFCYCAGLTDIIIPDSVTGMGNNAFYRCDGLTDITIPDSVTSLGMSAFANCAGLTDIKISENLADIEFMTFIGCDGLTDITIPDSVTNIAAAAFSSCANLARVTIGNRIAMIGESAFWSCTNLIGVYFWGDAPIADTNVFGNAEDVTVYHLFGTTGWGATFGERPTALWIPLPEPKIKANGRRGTVTVPAGQTVKLTVTMASGGYFGLNADWWVAAVPHTGHFWHYLNSGFNWVNFTAGDLTGLHPAYQGPLINIAYPPITVLPPTTLPGGVYDVYFIVDEYDGILNYPDGPYRMDSVRVTIQE